MKKLVCLALFLFLPLLPACMSMDPSAVADDTADDESAVTSSTSAVTVSAPAEAEVEDGVNIYAYENGEPVYTPPPGSFAEFMDIENHDGDDLRIRCTREVIYACGTLSDGRLMTCSRCQCGKLCTGAQEWCSDEMCDY